MSVRRIQFIDSLHGWMISYGATYKTTDGGENWIKYIVNTYVGNSCWFINQNDGWMCGANGTIYKTSNAGASWNLQSPRTPNLNYIVFNGNTGLAFGDFGAILKTSNGGISFINDNSNYKQIPEYNIYQNYPNPFNPVTTISYSINKSTRITIKVYDLLGRQITTLVNEIKSPGLYSVYFNGEHLPSGIYFYKLEAGHLSQIKKMILLK